MKRPKKRTQRSRVRNKEVNRILPAVDQPAPAFSAPQARQPEVVQECGRIDDSLDALAAVLEHFADRLSPVLQQVAGQSVKPLVIPTPGSPLAQRLSGVSVRIDSAHQRVTALMDLLEI